MSYRYISPKLKEKIVAYWRSHTMKQTAAKYRIAISTVCSIVNDPRSIRNQPNYNRS